MAITGAAVCAGGKPQLKFTYSGDYVVRDDGVVELHSSGTLVFLSKAVIDLFLVGGGGAGGGRTNAGYAAGGGGGGGYTKTVKNKSVAGSFTVVIGQGATGPGQGGSTSFGEEIVSGGFSGVYNALYSDQNNGGNGGSGGGGGIEGAAGGSGGSDGSNGKSAYSSKNNGGTGQGTTTREFGEATGRLYSGGGGGARGGAGGAGGGGNASAAGETNTGGGGGGVYVQNSTGYGGAGGSGIVCFRLAA